MQHDLKQNYMINWGNRLQLIALTMFNNDDELYVGDDDDDSQEGEKFDLWDPTMGKEDV